MSASEWSASEKKIAHRVFEAALRRELEEIMAKFKAKAAKVQSPEEMWAVRDYLERKQRLIDAKYDYRYSQLPIVFGNLLREGRIQEHELEGIAEEKLSTMRRVASL